MAQIVLSPKNKGGHYAVNVTVNYTETNVNTNNNTSDVYYEVILSRNSWSTSWTGYGQQIYVDVNINGVNNRVYIPRYNYNGQNLPNTVFGSGTVTGIVHESNGSKTIPISASIVDNANETYTSGSASSSSSMALTNIPRYANITSFNVNKRDETSLTIDFNVDATIDYCWYRIRQSGGSYGNWTSTNVSASARTFNITGLTANTTYITQIRVRRQESQLTSDSNEVRQTTYNYPYAKQITPSSFTIGSSITIDFENPLGRTFNYYILGDNNSIISSTTDTNITSISLIPNTTNLYNSIPNKQTGSLKIKVDYGTSSITSSVGTYNVNLNTDKPTFENFTSQYTADKTTITNDNQVAINSVSTITFKINSNATAKNGATISKYVVVWGNATPQTITNISNSVSLEKGNGDVIAVTAYDSRGINNTYNVPISELVPYTTPINLKLTLHRRNGTETTSYMDLTGTIYYDKFGTNGVSNVVTSIKYKVNNSSTEYTISDISGISYSSQSSDNHTQIFTIKNMPINENGSSGGFNVDNSYTITAIVLDTAEKGAFISGVLKDGKFAEDWYCDDNGEYHCGINGLANEDYALTVHDKILSESTLDIGTELNSDFRTNIISSRNLFDKHYGDEIINNNCTITEYGNGIKIQANTTTGRHYVGYKLNDDIIGKQITITTVATGTKTQYIWLCYVNGTTITEYIDTFQNANTVITRTIPSTIPSGSDGIAILFYVSYQSDTTEDYATYNDIMINYGGSSVPYEPYVKNPTIYVDGKAINNNNYSTNEQVVGTYMGKPLYRKVVDTGNIGDGASYVGEAYVYHMSIDYLDKIIGFEAYADALNEYIVSIRNHTWFDSSSNKLCALHSLINAYGDFIVICDTFEVPVHLKNSYVIVEYTKSTD